jgi:hypothetical protein
VATLRKIITDAYRESGIIQKGSQPDADQMQEGLDKLLMIIENTFGEEVGQPLEDVNYGDSGATRPVSVESNRDISIDNQYIRPWYRLLVNISGPREVFLDPVPYDGARFGVIDVGGTFSTAPLTITADTRKIEGSRSIVLNTSNVVREWFYRADLAEWVRVSPLTLDDNTPFASQFDDYFIIKLATRLYPRYLVTTAPETMMHFKEMQRKFRSRYNHIRELPSELALLRVGSNRRWNFRGFGNSSWFDRGTEY